MPENVIEAVSKEDLKKYILLGVNTFNGIAVFIPGQAGETLKKMSAILTQLANQDWFIDVVFFLLNTFQDKVATKEDVAEAMWHFATQLRKDEAPKIYTF